MVITLHSGRIFVCHIFLTANESVFRVIEENQNRKKDVRLIIYSIDPMPFTLVPLGSTLNMSNPTKLTYSNQTILSQST